MLRIKFLTAESLQEFIGIGRLGEAVNVEPFVVVTHCVSPAAYRQAFAELVDLLVAVAAYTELRWQRDLMRPATVNSRWRQLALAAHLQTPA